MLHAEIDQVGDRGDFDSMLVGEYFQIRHAGHRSVIFHDLANDTGRLESGKACEVNGTFRLTRPDQNAAFSGPDRKNMAGTDQVVGLGIVGNRRSDGGGAVGG
ncbi:MAG: hypothetical protein CSYNP_04519 [Syntrophus sp. SKADARSKE-3]|nr:hypothetical protein [Syntrophus sp. SKADARSKE-3]